MQLWDAFIKDYRDEIHDWTLRYTLHLFWHFCQDGNRAVTEFQQAQASQSNDRKKIEVPYYQPPYCPACGELPPKHYCNKEK